MVKLATEDDLKLMLQIQSPRLTRSIFCIFYLRKQLVTYSMMIGGDTMEELKMFVFDKKFLVGLIIGFTLGALHHYFGL